MNNLSGKTTKIGQLGRDDKKDDDKDGDKDGDNNVDDDDDDDCYLRRTSLGGTPSYFVNSCNCRRFNWKWSDQFFALGFYNQSNS